MKVNDLLTLYTTIGVVTFTINVLNAISVQLRFAAVEKCIDEKLVKK